MTVELNVLFDEEVKPRNRKRTPNYGISFDNGYAEGWVYGVPKCFRNALDIKKLRYVDKKSNKGTKENSPAKAGTTYKYVWTRGIPPSLSFAQGDVFYRPAFVRGLPWHEAVKFISHSIQILAARSDDQNGAGGWVEFQLTRYKKGNLAERLNVKLSQKEFEWVLRRGNHPNLKKQKSQVDLGPLFDGLFPEGKIPT